MKPVPAKSELRRLEAKRQRSEHREAITERVLRRVSLGALLTWVAFCVTASFLLMSGDDSMPWRLGQRLDQDVRARVQFEVVDQARTESERQKARELAPSVYSLNDKVFTTVRRDLESALDLAQTPDTDRQRFRQQAEARHWHMTDSALDALFKYAMDAAGQEAYRKVIVGLMDRLDDEYIVEPPSEPRREALHAFAILRRPGQPEQKVAGDQLVYASNRRMTERAIQQVTASSIPQPLQDWVRQVLMSALAGSPDASERRLAGFWNYDRQATAREMDAAERSVPPARTPYKLGHLVVPAGRVLTAEDLLLLRQEHEAFLSAQRTDPELRRKNLLREIGIIGVVILVSLGLATYAVYYQERVLNQTARSLGLASLILFIVMLSRLNERAQYPWDLPIEFAAGFTCIAAALLAIAYNQRFALGVCGSLAVLATIASRADLGLFLTLIAASSMMIFSLKEVRSRSRLVFAGFMAAFGAFVASFSCGLIAGQEVKYVVVHSAAAAFAAVGAGFVVQGILPQFERIFGVATSMTLLEWCDASRPLLRRLAQEAPDTYSHSLILGQMAEEASESIGARGLLARVGALYHDVGKIQKSDYFVENQEARMNRHDRLSPTMSLLIIVGHVKDGVEMARAYGLPRILHQFIAEHHGTTVVRYFHHAASEAAARNRGRHDREVPESEFRYPGPKPRSKETAILMICDGCEGAVRALTEPTPGRIESTVHAVVMDRLNDGQFDECDITLRELKLVEQSLVKSLVAIHHGRIKYPKPIGRDASPSESQTPRSEEAAVPAASRPAEVARQA